MKSKTQLFKDLHAILPTQFPDVHSFGLKAKGISNETYGRDSHIYIWCASIEQRFALEIELVSRGHKVNKKYFPGSPAADVLVSYFKGHHWDE